MVHDQDFEKELKEALDEIREFSPLGGFPKDFKERFRIDKTPKHGGRTSKGVFAQKAIKKGEMIGELRGRIDTKIRTRRTERVLDYALVVEFEGVFRYEMLCHNDQNSSWPRMINRPNTRQFANVTFELFEYPMPRGVRPCGSLRIIVEASQDIKRGTQLLADYDLNEQ